MKFQIQIYFLFIFVIIFSCNKNNKQSTKKTSKTIIFSATQKFSNLNKTERTLTIFSDSTYNFTEKFDDDDHSKIEDWKGFAFIKDDTLKFPFTLKYNRSVAAIIKNGFVEFFEGDYPERLKITSTNLKVNQNIDFRNFEKYSVFTFYKKFSNENDQKDLENYDLSTKDLQRIDDILKKTFLKNNNLQTFSNYFKQIVSVKN